MAQAGKTAAAKVITLLTAPAGLNDSVAALADAEGLALPAVAAAQITAQNVAIELAERSTEIRYPTLNIYCEKLSNTLREKFRSFSGTASMVIEVRLSQDRLEGLETKLQVYLDAVTQILDQSRGDWGSGMFYGGGYEAVIQPVKRGGRHFIQVAKVTFDVGVSN
ncbi:MAG TPA: hypothetical protein VG672_03225 [Bryobacteraceae bacterium]|jgi:hypothetical protein|nr:hypothetical protein [Bryobacteraceae bacterium]